MNANKMTVAQAAFLADQVERMFERAARQWVRGNNSGNPDTLKRCERKCDKLRRGAVSLLAPLHIEVDFPGLYPSFKVRGFDHHSALSAISAALEPQSNTGLVEAAKNAIELGDD